MKKTYYYTFIQTKAEEDAAKPNGAIFPEGRVLEEIRDLYPVPVKDPLNPWQIKKAATTADIITGKLLLLHNDVFEYIFRYWSLEMCSCVVAGHKVYTVIWDLTDKSGLIRYNNENIYLEKGPQDTFLLGWMDLVRKANINPGDEIGLYWDNRSGTFQFKVLHRRI